MKSTNKPFFMAFLFLTIISISKFSHSSELYYSAFNGPFIHSFDLSNPTEKKLWHGISITKGEGLNNDSWLCLSNTDASNGACETQLSDSEKGTESNIKLELTESRSKLKRVINLSASKWLGRGSGYAMKINGNWTEIINNEIFLTLRVDTAVLKTLPFGGKWEGTLKLKHTRGTVGNLRTLGEINSKIVLQARHDKVANIYIADSGRPKKLSFSRAGDKTIASQKIEMCLYDGYNSNSKNFELTIKDDSPRENRTQEEFSVMLDGFKNTNNNQRINYKIDISSPGLNRPAKNGEPITIENSESNSGYTIRKIQGVSEEIYCRNITLSIKSNPFNLLEKKSGDYKGNITVKFSPSPNSL